MSCTHLTFPLAVVDLEVDVADGEAAVALHHRHAVLAREEAHRLRMVDMRMILTIRMILVMRSTLVMGRMMIDAELVHGKDKRLVMDFVTPSIPNKKVQRTVLKILEIFQGRSL